MSIKQAIVAHEVIDQVCDALIQAWALGQYYRGYSDGQPQAPKAEETHAKFVALLDKTRAALAALRSMPAEPDYDALEREHMGDFEKKTGIYATTHAKAVPLIEARALNGLPEVLREAAGHLSAIMDEEIAEVRVIRHFLPDEMEGFALMVEDLATPRTAPVPLSDAEIRDMVTEWIDESETHIKYGMCLARDIERAVLGRGEKL